MASIRKRKNSYQITVSNGRDCNGKQIIETTTYTPDKSLTSKKAEVALKKFALEFEYNIKNGDLVDGDKITFKNYIEKWEKGYANKKLKETTIAGYRFQLNDKIIPKIGHIKMSKINATILEEFYDELLERGQSPSSVKRIHGIIGSIMTYAYKKSVIKESPCNRVELPEIKKVNDIKYFTLTQAENFLKALEIKYPTTYKAHICKTKYDKQYNVAEYTETRGISLQFQVFFNIALFGGLRRGELIALTWDDIDLINNTVCINKSTALLNNNMITKDPKTYSSYRTIVLPKTVISLIKKYKKEYLQYKLSLGSQWNKNETGTDCNYLFIQWNGAQMHLSTPTHKFKEILNNYNRLNDNKDKQLPLIRLHDLRHTSATLLISSNIDIKTVSNRLGHAQTSTTLNIYAHALEKLDIKASEELEKLLLCK